MEQMKLFADRPRPTIVNTIIRRSDYGFRATYWLDNGAHLHQHAPTREGAIEKLNRHFDAYLAGFEVTGPR